MATITPIPVCDADGATIKPVRVCNLDGATINRVDAAAARLLALAPNAQKEAGGQVVRTRKGEIVRIILGSMGDDSQRKQYQGDPRRYTFLYRSEDLPQGVHTLRHLPKSTAALYVTVRTDCMKTAA
jgi:hypothetical protein